MTTWIQRVAFLPVNHVHLNSLVVQVSCVKTVRVRMLMAMNAVHFSTWMSMGIRQERATVTTMILKLDHKPLKFVEMALIKIAVVLI